MPHPTRKIRAINDAHPHAATLDWLLVLLNAYRYPDIEELKELALEIHLHLAPLRPSAKIPTPDDIQRQLGDGFLNLPVVLTRAVELFRLKLKIPEIDWEDALELNFPRVLRGYEFPWQLREQIRFTLGTYKSLPWASALPPIPDHYAHLAIDASHLIAYTQDANKGRADIQTPIKPGRYLARFYPDLTSDRVRELQSAIIKPGTLKFAVTADEIEAVYVNGPTSCMSRPASTYESDEHPVRVYGDSDLQLAYVADHTGHATARTLIWPAKKIYVRIYGDEVLLKALLEQEGYHYGSSHGARIHRIDHRDHRVVMPYIDDDQSFEIIDENWLKIGGDINASSTCGTASVLNESCAYCDASFHPDDLYNVAEESWCESCYDDSSFSSELSDQRYPDSMCVTAIVERSVDGTLTHQSWAEHERDEHAFHCDGSHLYYANEHFTAVTLENGEVWEEVTLKTKNEVADPPVPDNDNATSSDVAVQNQEAA